MTTPVGGAAAGGAPALNPERWRALNAILERALDCEPGQRNAFVADACGNDLELRREIVSLLAAHDTIDDEFLERPAVESLGVVGPPHTLGERLAAAVAGRYVVERELARGGMATVFLARDLRHDRHVAIKVLRDEIAAAVGAERFLEEIRVTASLQHPHILPLFDSGSAGGLLWYVMPFVEGETLRTRLTRGGRLAVEEAVRLVREIADALEHAHRHGVVHRDVKPENVLLHDGHALVADFGIALAVEQAGGDRLTRTGITLGTPQYMAPEQAIGERTIDARTDVYALGTVLYEMIAGEPPFAAPSQAAVLWRVKSVPPTALATHRVDVPPALDAAVQRALAKRPDDRFASAAAFADGIGGALTGVAVDHESLGDRVSGDHSSEAVTEHSQPRTVSARAAMYAASATLILGLAGGWLLGRPAAPTQPTDQSSDVAARPANPAARWPRPASGDLVLNVVDRSGKSIRSIPANRPWTPRISPDGKRVAYGAFGEGRNTSDLWVMDIESGQTKRLTDDDGDSNDPQWSPDSRDIAFSVNAPDGKDLSVISAGGGAARTLATRAGTQFASDWLRDGSALLVTDDAGDNHHDILVQPTDGSPARPYAATGADELAARISSDGKWVAYTSSESGQTEVYLDSFIKPGHRVALSQGGGEQPVWRGDGSELYYWHDGSLIAVQLEKSWGDAPPKAGARTTLFRAPIQGSLNTMYDVTPDGQRFVIVQTGW